MSEMIDLGYKPPKGELAPATKGEEERINYPSFSLYRKVPASLMSKEVGESVRLEIIAKITNKGIDESTKSKRENMTLDVHKMRILGADVKDLEDKIAKRSR